MPPSYLGRSKLCAKPQRSLSPEGQSGSTESTTAIADTNPDSYTNSNADSNADADTDSIAHTGLTSR